MLLDLGTPRLGTPTKAMQARIDRLADPDELKQLLGRVGTAATWRELLGAPRRS